ncbi:hypothetical protein BC629DRAFT_1538058 [Irpex lacteus]|nr:hypothetical protein BC629DRAFT_1538058 [Irpex lacteus]
MEEEESAQTETEEDLTEAEDEVMASLERFESEGLGGEVGGGAEGEDEGGNEVEGREEDGFEEVDEIDASVEEEVELRRVSYDDVQTARTVRADMEEDEDEQIADASVVSHAPSPPRTKTKTLPVTKRHETERREERGRRLSRHSSTTRSPPLSRTPSLPSEPDVFMDEESLSMHAESASAFVSARNGRTPVSGSHNVQYPLNNQANSVSASVSTPQTKYRRQSSRVHVNAEAGPSTVSGASKSSSKSPSKTKARFLFHDPEAWAAPSFQRNDSKAKKAETSASANVVSSRPSLGSASASKGKGKQVESTISGAQAQGKDVKMPVVDQASNGKRPSSDHQPAAKRKRPTPADESMTSTPNLRPHKRRKQSESPSPPASPPRKRRAVSDKQSILRDVPPAPELAKTDSLTSTVDRIRKISLKREESLPFKARSSVSHASVKNAESKADRSKMRQSSSSHGGEEFSPAPSARASGSRPAQPMVRKKRKLGGFKLDLDLDVRDHPGLVTWDVLGDMLLRIQKAREREREREQQRERERDRE